MHNHPDVTFARAGNVGDFPIAETFRPKGQGLTLRQRQLADQGRYMAAEVGPFGGSGRIEGPIATIGGPALVGLLRPLTPSQEVHCIVAADGEKPWAGRVAQSVARLPAQSQETVLHGIPRGVVVAQQAAGKAKQAGLVLLDRLHDPAFPIHGRGRRWHGLTPSVRFLTV